MKTKCTCLSFSIDGLHAPTCPMDSLPNPTPIDPADELGKVWDVLHAAGINGAGGMSASEGVKVLADKLLNLQIIIANDAYAATFQSMGQYRTALGAL